MTDTGVDKGTKMKAETFLPDDYRPAEDEPFMNERQLEWFRRELLEQRSELLNDSKSTIAGLQDGTRNIPDVADRASEGDESGCGVELKAAQARGQDRRGAAPD